MVAGNWKMHKNFQEGTDLIQEILDLLEKHDLDHTTLVLGTPFIHLKKASRMLKGLKNAGVAAQNCHWEDQGAFTGEIAAPMIHSTGAGWVIIGHSERREYFGETHEQLRKKAESVIRHQLGLIFCIGETLAVRESGQHFEWVKRQLTESLFQLPAAALANVVLAYEPVWAIGTGKTATAAQAQEMHAFLRRLLSDQYGPDIAAQVPILYGGSCKPSNARELFAQPDVDGGLIGGASLVAHDFVAILRSFA